MRSVVWRFFPPPEVKATRERIAEFLRRVSPTYPLPAELKRRAIALTRDVDYVLDCIRIADRTPDHVALVVLSSSVLGMLMSGRYHVYRGVLSGEGHALVAVFVRCMSELERCGYQTADATHDATERMRNEVNKLG